MNQQANEQIKLYVTNNTVNGNYITIIECEYLMFGFEQVSPTHIDFHISRPNDEKTIVSSKLNTHGLDNFDVTNYEDIALILASYIEADLLSIIGEEESK